MENQQQLPSLEPDSIRDALSAYSPELIDDASLTPSAVLVPILASDDGHKILFTVRTSRVEHHKGEVSFPGGARDSEDESISVTAVRETHEEVGIQPEHIELLGRMNDHKTRSGYHITPFIGFIPDGYSYEPSLIEVNVVLEVPFEDLWRVYLEGPQQLTYFQNTVTAYEFHHDGHRIWGATAGILTEFFDILLAAGKS